MFDGRVFSQIELRKLKLFDSKQVQGGDYFSVEPFSKYGIHFQLTTYEKNLYHKQGDKHIAFFNNNQLIDRQNSKDLEYIDHELTIEIRYKDTNDLYDLPLPDHDISKLVAAAIAPSPSHT